MTLVPLVRVPIEFVEVRSLLFWSRGKNQIHSELNPELPVPRPIAGAEFPQPIEFGSPRTGAEDSLLLPNPGERQLVDGPSLTRQALLCNVQTQPPAVVHKRQILAKLLTRKTRTDFGASSTPLAQ